MPSRTTTTTTSPVLTAMTSIFSLNGGRHCCHQQQPPPSSSLRPLLLLLFFFLSFAPRTADSIICYKCDAIESPQNDCPGWHRAPVDTFIDRQDRGGLFTHCVEIRLINGTVIHQDAYPNQPTCGNIFMQVCYVYLYTSWNDRRCPGQLYTPLEYPREWL